MNARRHMPGLCLALALLATPAAAQQRVGLATLAGAWAFQTEAHAATGCIIRGGVTATQSGRTLRMDMRVHETCNNGREWRAREACVATLVESVLSVRCEVVEGSENYNADQFTLNVVSTDEMSGRLYDHGVWDNGVVWRRDRGPLVS